VLRYPDVSCDIPSPAALSAAAPSPSAAVEPRRRLPAIQLRGVRLHAVTEQQTIDTILRGLDEGRGGVVMTPNLDHMRRCVRDLSFSAMLDEAELVVADGMPLVWASRLQGTPLPRRVAGSDLISALSGTAAKQGRSVFLLGGIPGTAEAAATVLLQQFPRLKVTGHHCPPMGFDNDHADMATIIAKLAHAQPDIVYVALGSPKQERLIAMLRLVLPKAWWLGVGMSFSFLAGHVRRAPLWMRENGLEWMHRLGQEPRRLFKRYIIFGIPFAGKLLAESTVHGLARKVGLGGTGVFEDERKPSWQTATVRNKPSAAPPAPAPAIISTSRSALSLDRLRAIVLLTESRPGPLTTASGRNVLDLPASEDSTLFNLWLARAAEAAKSIGLARLPLRILLSQSGLEPRSAASRNDNTCTIERDLSDDPGTGGVLARLVDDYDDSDVILVAGAAQIVVGDLAGTLVKLAQAGGLVNLLGAGEAADGLMLMGGKALRLIPKGGFVDMREQALPAIAASQDVRLVRADAAAAATLPAGTLPEYIDALRRFHAAGQNIQLPADPLAEEAGNGFFIAENGSHVDPKAIVQDTVVLAGGTVSAGGVAVRSLVCSGGIVQRDRLAADELIVASDRPRARYRTG
jgi:N-acetylglucosaminyldiphosphoundecaprenol N-acetyl-beta-D-mannosaminyltransferase